MGISFFVAMALAFVASGALGMGVERYLIRYLYKRPLDTLLANASSTVVVGIFGMNIKNNVENEHGMFLLVVLLGSAATIGMFIILLRVCRYYRLF